MATSFCAVCTCCVAAGDDVAQPVPDEVADDAAGHGPQDVGAQPVRAPSGPRAAERRAELLLPGVLELANRRVNGHGWFPSCRERNGSARCVGVSCQLPFDFGAP